MASPAAPASTTTSSSSTPTSATPPPPPPHPLVPPPPAKYTGRIPNTPLFASLISFLLGALFALGCLFFISPSSPSSPTINHNPFLGLPLPPHLNLSVSVSRPSFLTPHLAFFAAAWAFFHWAEYAVTAGWNLEKCSVDSFLLENGSLYHIAHGTAVAEYVLTLYWRPDLKTWPYVSFVGILLVLTGQLLRSSAMIHASTNFSHAVAFKKRPSHVLVTSGIYAYLRHPSYAGFFWWALGTQLVLQNPISFVTYAVILWRFFYYRTRAEERALVVFFGEQYVQYRKRVGTMIPFVP